MPPGTLQRFDIDAHHTHKHHGQMESHGCAASTRQPDGCTLFGGGHSMASSPTKPVPGDQVLWFIVGLHECACRCAWTMRALLSFSPVIEADASTFTAGIPAS